MLASLRPEGDVWTVVSVALVLLAPPLLLLLPLLLPPPPLPLGAEPSAARATAPRCVRNRDKFALAPLPPRANRENCCAIGAAHPRRVSMGPLCLVRLAHCSLPL